MIPLLRYVEAARARRGRRSAAPDTKALTLAAAGLIVSATVPLARDALHGPVSVAIAVSSFLFMAFTERDTLWIIAGSAIVGLLAGALA